MAASGAVQDTECGEKNMAMEHAELQEDSDHDHGNNSRLIRRNTRQSPRQHITDTYYGDNTIEQTDVYDSSLPIDQDIKKMETKQSKKLPPWIWYILAKSLGIKVHELDKPWFGTIMHAITLLFAIAFACSFTWYTIYDIVNVYTKQTVLTGLTAIVVVVYYCTLGVYANKLAGKLFSSQKFIESVRLHSRTIFKVSAAGLMIMLTVAITVVDNYASAYTFNDEHCQNVSVPVIVCKINYVSRVGYSVFNGLWNLMVGIILLSVCRTHTIGVRRFIRELEEDGRIIEMFYRKHVAAQQGNNDDSESQTEEEYLWDDDEISPEFTFSPRLPPGSHLGSMSNSLPATPTRRISHRTHSMSSQRNSPPKNSQPTSAARSTGEAFQFPPPGGMAELEPVAASNRHTENHESHSPKPVIIVKADSMCQNDEDKISIESEDSDSKVQAAKQLRRKSSGRGQQGEALGKLNIQADPPSHASRSTRSQMDSPQHSLRVELNSPRKIPSTMTGPMSENDRASSTFSLETRGFTNEDILMRYWKINTRMRSTSIALQRWLIAWIIFILIWCSSFLIFWLTHEAKLVEIAEFVLPLLLLPLITSAYGEVNMEGKRMLRCICPTDERIQMLYFMQQQPLQMTAFNFAINYSAIVTALGALSVAFCTKIILDEIDIK